LRLRKAFQSVASKRLAAASLSARSCCEALGAATSAASRMMKIPVDLCFITTTLPFDAL
jgi:hypothetical protein